MARPESRDSVFPQVESSSVNTGHARMVGPASAPSEREILERLFPEVPRKNQESDDFLRFAVLGPVRAWHGDEELDLGSPQQRAVLAALLLRRGRPVTVGELVDAVWGEEPPSAAVSVLRTYVSRLRKALKPEPGTPDSARVIRSVADGYAAHVPEGALDLGVFEQRVAEAKKRQAAGESSAAAELLHAALDGWSGAPLAGLPGPLAEAERARLSEERLNTLETRLDIDIQLGRHGEVITQLTSLAGENPLRERLCLLLMLALYRAGRQAEALAAYRRTWRTLVTELGIEPGAPLRELHDRMLAADESLTPPPAPEGARPSAEPAPVSAVDVLRPAQLPADPPIFTGRAAELEEVCSLFREHGSFIGVIGGMAGIGKTTLAVYCAHKVADLFSGGQFFINLRGFDPTGSAVTPEDAVRTFLDALGVPAQRIPASFDAQVALYRSLLADRRVLILLDNARDTDQVRPLLPGSPGCLVIVTSRNQLTGLIVGDGAYPLTLHQLTHADANKLLARRLGAERLAAEPRAADEIIARCARLPLALAIVAARAAINTGFTLGAIADELRDSQGSLDAFVGGDLSTDVRTVFSWSYEALSTPAARLFRLLGLPSGHDISAQAAAALAGLPLRETRGLLVELTRAHLLTEHFPGRYSLHDLVRVYATERVLAEEPPGKRDRAVERLLSWYLYTADAAYVLLTPRRRRIPLEPLPPDCRPMSFTDYNHALDWCDTERSNLVAAVHKAAETGLSGITWRLPAVLWGFFYLRSHSHDWLDVTQTALTAVRGTSERLGEVQLLVDTSSALLQLGRYDETIDHLREAMVACRQLGESHYETLVTGNLGNVFLYAGQLDEAVEYGLRALARFRTEEDAWGEGIGLVNVGDAYQRLGRFDEALGCLGEALTVLRASDNRWVEGVALDTLGTVSHRIHRQDDALEYYHQALLVHRDVGNRMGEAHTLSRIGDVQLDSGSPEAARTSWQEALAVFGEFDHQDAEETRTKLRRLGEHPPGALPGSPSGGTATATACP